MGNEVARRPAHFLMVVGWRRDFECTVFFVYSLGDFFRFFPNLGMYVFFKKFAFLCVGCEKNNWKLAAVEKS
jgi:hypothetical protein